MLNSGNSLNSAQRISLESLLKAFNTHLPTLQSNLSPIHFSLLIKQLSSGSIACGSTESDNNDLDMDSLCQILLLEQVVETFKSQFGNDQNTSKNWINVALQQFKATAHCHEF